MRLRSLSLLVVPLIALVVAGCGGPKRTCEEAGKNYVGIKWPNEKTSARVDEFVARCHKEKPPQATIDCLGNAKNKDDLNKCP